MLVRNYYIILGRDWQALTVGYLSLDGTVGNIVIDVNSFCDMLLNGIFIDQCAEMNCASSGGRVNMKFVLQLHLLKNMSYRNSRA
jgi:hypothetical protein